MPNPQRFCIFCGGPGLTREHIYANWLRNYIPREMKSYTKSSSLIHPTRIKTLVKKEPGDPHSRRVKVVCGSCNNGWMSKLQESAKPILIPLIKGEHAILDRDSQAVISAWVSMAVIVADSAEPDKSAIHETDRQWLYRNKSAPMNWTIWLGDFSRRAWKGHWFIMSWP
jgi:hypothetical protein